MNRDIAILIPCYNEAQTIAKVVADAKKNVPEATVYVYDNNSIDGSGKLAQEAGATVIPEPKQGKGNVVRSMFEQIDADCYLMVDADDTYDLSQAHILIDDVLNDGVDMAIGDRLDGAYFTENKRPFHNFGNTLVRALVNLCFGGHIRDVMTGYRAFSRRFAKSFNPRTNGFEIETEMSIFSLVKRMKLSSHTIAYKDRPKGSQSKLSTFSDGRKVLNFIVRSFFHFKPFKAMAWLFSPLIILGVALGIAPLVQLIQDSAINVGLGLAAAVILGVGILLLIAGLIWQLNLKGAGARED